MRICFLSDARYIHTQRWIEYFAKKGHEIHIISNGQAKINGATIHQLNILKLKIPYFNTIKNIIWFKGFIRRIRPDIIHMHYLEPFGLAPILCDFKPFIVSTWGSDILGFLNESVESFRQQFSKKFILKKATIVTSTTKFLAKATAKYANLDWRKIEIVPFGVDINQFSPQSKIKSKRITIGMIKHLLPKYGVEYLIKAIPQVYNQYKNIKVLIVGSGYQRDYLIELVKKLKIENIVTFQEEVPYSQVPTYLSQIDIFVMPSISESESFGVAAIEAQAMEIPVVASRVGGVSEAVWDGETGILIEPKNPQAIADALMVLLQNEERRLEMGKKGREFVIQSYDWNKNAGKMESLYKALLNKKERYK